MAFSPRIRAGRLRHQVQYQTRTQTKTASGQSKSTWGPSQARYASVVPMSGDEATIGGQESGVVTHEVTIRYHGGESPKDRIVFGTRVLEIRRIVNVDELNRKLVILCSEVVK